MMNLFSSFNPISSYMTSWNWMHLIIVTTFLFISYWKTSNKTTISNKLLPKFINNQFKKTFNKINISNLPLTTTMLMLILYMNLTGLTPETFSLTSHLVINMSLAMTLWMSTTIKKMKNKKKIFASLTPMDTPFMLIPFMVLIELVSLVIQPITLSIRLTANVTAGHIMLILISYLYNINFIPTMICNTMMMIMEIIVSIIQAYVFSMLMTMYNK